MPDEPTRYYTRYLSQVTGPYPRSTIGRMAQSRRLTRGHEVSSDQQHWVSLEEFLVQDGSVNSKTSTPTVSGPTYRATYRMEKIEERFAPQPGGSRNRFADRGRSHVSAKIWIAGAACFVIAIAGLVIFLSSSGGGSQDDRQAQSTDYSSNRAINNNSNDSTSKQTQAPVTNAGAAAVRRTGGHSRSNAISQYTGSVVVPAIQTPIWLKLVRRGNRVSAYYSRGGRQWTQLGSSQPIAFSGATICAGMAVCAHNDGALNTAQFSHVTITRTQSGWSDANIGYPAKLGSARESGGAWTVTGGGSDVWDKHDQFNLYSRKVNGDSVIEARVDSLTNTDPWAKVGVMFRGSISARAPYAYIFVTPSLGLAFQYRPHGTGS